MSFWEWFLWEFFEIKVEPKKIVAKRRKIKKALRQGIKDCSTCSFDRMLFEGPGCWRIKYYGYRSLDELTEKEKQECHLYRENPDCKQCSLYKKNWTSSWCDYFDVSCAETAVLTHPAATGSWGCTHWRSKLEQPIKVNSKINRDAANKKVDEVIKNIKD